MQVFSKKDLEQKTTEWLVKRAGYFTASDAQAIASNGAGLKTLCKKKAMILAGIPIEHFENEHTERGNELEPIARAMFELETGNLVQEVGFVVNGDLGCSPDGLIGTDEGLEIKCVNNDKYADLLLAEDKLKEADSKYIWQCQHSLLVSGRKKWYLTYYNPNFRQNLVIIEILPDEEKFQKIITGANEGKKLLNEYLNKLK